jgi:hypothetical protein
VPLTKYMHHLPVVIQGILLSIGFVDENCLTAPWHIRVYLF